jgi:hypothetical protein
MENATPNDGRCQAMGCRDGLQGGGERVEGVGEDGLLFRGERRKPEAAADEEIGLAPELLPPPDDGTPDDLDWKATFFPLTRRERFVRTFSPSGGAGAGRRGGARPIAGNGAIAAVL